MLMQKNRAIQLAALPTIVLLATLTILLPRVSDAVELGVQGQGQVLIFPYYNMRNGNSTLLSVTNTTTDSKAIKVRVLEGDNGQNVLQFNLYLGPWDVWTASLSERVATDGSVVPALVSQDVSCIVPAGLISSGVIDPQAPGVLSAEAFTSTPDGGRQSVDRVKEGYVQMIEMGTMVGASGLFAQQDQNGSGIPLDCPYFTDAWGDVGNEQSVFRQNPQLDMQPPSGGLVGDGAIINVIGARAAAYEAVALNGFYMPEEGVDEPSLHTAPEVSAPGLAAASPPVSRVLLDSDTGAQIIEDTWDNGLQAVDAVLMADQIISQYAAEAFIAGATEWVLTFPGKQAHVSQVAAPVPPYTSLFETDSPDIASCEVFEALFVNRDQARGLGSGFGDPPPPPPSTQLCYEVNLVTFNGSFTITQDSAAHEQDGITSDFLASRLFINYDLITTPGFETGWMNIAFNGEQVVDENIEHSLINPTSGRTYRGLPVVGFAVRGAENRGINALFGTGFQHSYQRVILPAE